MTVQPPRHRAGPLVAVLLLALVCTGCAITIRGTPAAAEPPLRTSAPPTPLPTGRPTPTGVPGLVPLVVQPVIPGWSPVRSVNRAAAYDVPPTWTVLSEDTVVGFEDPNTLEPRVASTGVAEFGEGVCSESGSIALAVIRHDEGDDLAVASKNNAEVWADAAYRDDDDAQPELETGPPERVTTVTGLPAVIVKVDVTTASPVTDCGITTATVWAISATDFDGELGPTVSLVILVDGGVPETVPEPEIRRILSTLRPVA